MSLEVLSPTRNPRRDASTGITECEIRTDPTIRNLLEAIENEWNSHREGVLARLEEECNEIGAKMTQASAQAFGKSQLLRDEVEGWSALIRMKITELHSRLTELQASRTLAETKREEQKKAYGELEATFLAKRGELQQTGPQAGQITSKHKLKLYQLEQEALAVKRSRLKEQNVMNQRLREFNLIISTVQENIDSLSLDSEQLDALAGLVSWEPDAEDDATLSDIDTVETHLQARTDDSLAPSRLHTLSPACPLIIAQNLGTPQAGVIPGWNHTWAAVQNNTESQSKNNVRVQRNRRTIANIGRRLSQEPIGTRQWLHTGQRDSSVNHWLPRSFSIVTMPESRIRMEEAASSMVRRLTPRIEETDCVHIPWAIIAPRLSLSADQCFYSSIDLCDKVLDAVGHSEFSISDLWSEALATKITVDIVRANVQTHSNAITQSRTHWQWTSSGDTNALVSSHDNEADLVGYLRSRRRIRTSATIGEILIYLFNIMHDMKIPGIPSPPTVQNLHRHEVLNIQRKLCSNFKILPNSCILPAGSVTCQCKYPRASGGFADVWEGQYDGRAVALKVMRVDNTVEDPKGLFQEAVIWKRLRHRNVVYFHGVEWHLFHPRLTLVSDWMPNGRITDYLQTNLRANRIKLILNIAEGLEYLHVEGFVHGDVKGANILVDEEHVARLADFGLADLYYTSRIGSKSVPVGSTRWAAPEVLDPEHFERESVETSPQADIYAFAMVIWEVFTGRLPFFHFKRDATVIHNVLKGKRPPRPVQAIPLGLSDNVWTLMEACWDEDHQTRPHISDIANTLRDELTRRPIDVEDQVPAEWPLVIQHNLLDDILMTQSVGAKIESHSAICLSR